VTSAAQPMVSDPFLNFVESTALYLFISQAGNHWTT